MTTTLVYDRTRLTEMSAEELEESREAGYAFRRELTHAVMAGIAVPEAWDMNGEYGSEFGGFFPVQVAFDIPIMLARSNGEFISTLNNLRRLRQWAKTQYPDTEPPLA